MNKYRPKGMITIFLSLTGAVLLSLLCTTIESARIQGCRAKAAAALDMGMFSVMGQFERELLERYDVFFLDGASGGTSYSKEQINQELVDFMEYNVYPNKERLLKGFDPFSLQMNGTEVHGVCLATDENGAAFYQQAVGFMRENLPTEILSTLLERMEDGKRLEEAAELYKKRDEQIERELKELEEQKQELEKQQELERQQAQEAGQELAQTETEEKPSIPVSRNPLLVIAKIKQQGLMKLVLGDKAISEKKLPSDSPSKRRRNQGNLPVEKKYSGLTSDLIFQQYLFERFSLFTDEKKEGVLDYELEYILCGKGSDKQNLKSVITRLMLLREGANFLYLVSDAASMEAAHALAAILVGSIPIPGLVTVTAYALLLVWAYGESLLDLRELFAGGKIPILKNSDSWRLDLMLIPDLMQLLEGTNGSSENGISYVGYLQILYMLGNRGRYPIRALDMVEGYMRGRTATSDFRADHAVCKIRASADYRIPSLFLRIPAAFLKTGLITQEYRAQGSFAY